MSTDVSRRPVRRFRRAVVDANGRVYPSVTDAAVEYGIGVPGIWTKARLQRHGWRFADEPLRQPAAPSPRRGG